MSNGSAAAASPVIAIPDYGATETVMFNQGIEQDQAPLIDTATNQGAASGSKECDGPVYRDVSFAVLFLLHLGIMAWLGISVAPSGYEQVHLNVTLIEDAIKANSDDVTESDLAEMEELLHKASEFLSVYALRILYYLVGPGVLVAFTIALGITAMVIKPWPKPFVYGMLINTVAGAGFILISTAVASKSILVYFLCGIAWLFVMYYIRLAWRIVPFASINLKFALAGITNNWSIYIVAFFLSELGSAWTTSWLYVIGGLTATRTTKFMETHPDFDYSSAVDTDCGPPFPVVLALLLSLYWTSEVMMNSIHVTVAGVMGTWCFVREEADRCFSPAVYYSLCRSFTYSFGSICMGSLLQAVVSVLRHLVKTANHYNGTMDQQNCGGLVACVLECLTRYLGDVLEYFNEWAYVFVGIYGLSYIDSGRNVIELFRARGWTTIIADNLVGYTLGMTTFAIGVLTGVVGVMVERSAFSNDDPSEEENSYIFGSLPHPGVWAFIICFVVGIWVASVMMSVVNGAVNAVIVCWADSPSKLAEQHPHLTSELAEAWAIVYPEESPQSFLPE